MKWAGCLGLIGLAGCTAFPESAKHAEVTIDKIVDAIECELAAAARNKELQSRNISNWIAATELDLTLVRSVGADGGVKVSAPMALALFSAAPKVGGSYADTRTSHIKFANSFQKALKDHPECTGDDPSQTQMGLAYWLEGSVLAINKDLLIGVSFTKQFQVIASASARFGYTLEPVTNPVSADAGFGGSRDLTHRFTIALTPPPAPAPPAKPLKVEVTNWRQLVPRPSPTTPPITPPAATPPPTFPPGIPAPNQGSDRLMKPFSEGVAVPAEGTLPQVRRQRAPRPQPSVQPAITPRQRVQQDLELNQMLQRKSPVILAPETLSR